MLKWIVYLLLAAAYVLVTLFGLGPVLLADGSSQERLLTLLIVILTYVIITLVLLAANRKLK